jgi:excisionase family DNA binding protein
LTKPCNYATLESRMGPLSTREVCDLVRIHKATLERWLASGKLRPPQPIKIGGRVFRYWTQRDVERVRRFKEKFYRKGRGRKPKSE